MRSKLSFVTYCKQRTGIASQRQQSTNYIGEEMKNFSKLAILVVTLVAPAAMGQIYQSQPRVYQQPIYQQPQYGQPIQGTVGSHWSQTITQDTAHDFGAVAKASKQEHTFEFVNNLDTDLHLLSVRASCGCTIATILTPVVKPGEKGKLHAKYDTLKFDGARGATLSVSIRKDKPYTEYAELQFSVKGQIRRDVVLQPASVDFTDVLSGKTAQRTLTVMYAGDPNWQIKEVKSSNKNVQIELRETRRDANARRIDYEMVVTINGEQDSGQFTDNLTIVTNDVANQMINVDVGGRIQSVIETTDIQLGVLNKNQKIEKSMIIRGARPFKIEQIMVDNPAIRIVGHEGEKTLHIVRYTLDTSKVQKISEELRIITNDPLQAEAKLSISAQIVPGTFAGGQK